MLERVLVVAFGSAPGVPNWGGLLGRMYRSVAEAHRWVAAWVKMQVLGDWICLYT